MAQAPGFQPISVRRSGLQTPSSRFGSLFEENATLMDDDWSVDLDDSEDDEDGPSGAPSETEHEAHSGPVPTAAPWRINLTGLSQHHNLFMVAIGGEIHVHVPRGQSSKLPLHPDLTLKPPRSSLAHEVGGYIDRMHPHWINHLIVGMLGEEEILLCCCDDGDVLAYRVGAIQALIADRDHHHRSHDPVQLILPFFHENVGKSAWGLAIHKQSRLLAVSSNRKEVTIYYFGLSLSTPPNRYDDDMDIEPRPLQEPLDPAQSGKETQQEAFPNLEDAEDLRCDRPEERIQNFRRVIEFGERGDNIPTITFADGKSGDAEELLAKDIRGNIWIVDVWSNDIRRTSTGPYGRTMPDNGMGWGVLVLQPSSFLPAKSHREMFGCVNPRHLSDFVDVTQGLQNLPDYSRYHPTLLNNPNFVHEDDDEQETEQGDVEFVDDSSDVLLPPVSAFEETDSNSDSEDTDQHRKKRRFRDFSTTPIPVPFPITQEHLLLVAQQHMNNVSVSQSSLSPDESAASSSQPDSSTISEIIQRTTQNFLRSDAIVFHTCRRNITLLPLLHHHTLACLPNLTATACFAPLVQTIPPTHIFVAAMERLSLLIHIPELYLVVVGTQTGRVALITLTRPTGRTDPNSTLPSSLPDAIRPDYSFRVDHVLPFKSEESCGDRPACALLGIAASPVRESDKRLRSYRQSGSRPTRFRLLMYYWNHTLLSYELERTAEDQLMIF